jgi:uncharacterized SAM-dependent methyltransferase
MVLVAREAALKVVPAANCFPLVCDLSTALDLAEVLAGLSAPGVGRLVTFFGMIPNFEPDTILPRLASVVQPGGHLLFSANLAPGTDYAAGVRQILPLYDNALTRDWLTTFLFDLGVEPGDGEIRFSIDEKAGAPAIKRVVAYFHFLRPRRIRVGEDLFEFPAGETIRLFFSYRHTPAIISKLLSRHGLRVRDQWITDSQEEGVFLCQKASA